MTKVFQKYISNIFISIVQRGGEWIVYSEVVKNGILKDRFSKNFDIKESDSISLKMQEYLNSFQEEYNFAYLALFLDSMGQGAINGTTAIDFEKNSVDMKNVTHLGVDKNWSVYASFIDLNWVKKLFSKVGLDFIYSPFVLQYSLMKKEGLKERPTLYILNHQDSIVITIYEKSNLLFGAYFKATTDDGLSSSGVDDWESVQEEESIGDVIELDDMEDMEELEDLSELDVIASENKGFEETKPDDFDLGRFDGEDVAQDSCLELFGREVLIYKYLTSSLEEFYKNPLYKSSFIDTVVIYDGYEVSSDLIGMIEDELFMDIEMNKIDISKAICKMARQEAFI